MELLSAEAEALAVRHPSVTLLITASSPAAVEHVARRVHAAGHCAASAFVCVSAGEFREPAVLTETCRALLGAAAGGSLLLADIENTPEAVQDRLVDTLAGLQAHCTPSVAVRLMAGTTASLPDRIADGRFSERLFYRLNIIHIVTPAVRRRRDQAPDSSGLSDSEIQSACDGSDEGPDYEP